MRLAITVVLLSISPSAAQIFYSHSSADTVHSNWASTAQSSYEHTLGFSFPFLGSGMLLSGDKLHISNYGAVSYNSMGSTEMTVDDAKDNIVLAAFFAKTSGVTGTVKIEELLISAADTAIHAHMDDSTFTGSDGLLITWEGAADALDSAKKASFQMYIVTNSDSSDSYAVMNYETIDFSDFDHNGNTEAARAGIYVESEDVNICHHQMNSTVDRDQSHPYGYVNNNNLDLDSVIGTSNCAFPGRWVMRIGTEIPCVTQFDTACGTPEAAEAAVADPYFKNGDGWDFFMRYTCKPTLVMSADVNGQVVTTKDNYCLYDSDYYTSQWSCDVEHETVKCIDPVAADQLELEAVFTGFPDDQTLDEFWVEDSDPQTQERIDMETTIINTIKAMLTAIGLDDATLTNVIFDKLSVNRELSDDGEELELVVEFEVLVASSEKIQPADVALALKEEIEENADNYDLTPSPVVDVKDKLPACMTMCLGCKKPGGCDGTPPALVPNRCCGTCSSTDYQGGKPYSTLDTKMCCHDTYVYDYETQTCCEDDDGPFLSKSPQCD